MRKTLIILCFCTGLPTLGILLAGSSPGIHFSDAYNFLFGKLDKGKRIVRPIKNPIEYNLECLNDAEDMGLGTLINLGKELENMSLDVISTPVSVAEEEKLGDELVQAIRDKYELIESGSKYDEIQKIARSLIKNIKNPKGFSYEVFLMKSEDLNAFTAGAKIFITEKMYDFCASEDELACVIGHEIYHNELGHINRHIQKSNTLTPLGAGLVSYFTIPFGQQDETMSDLKGIDLAFASGYNACVSVDLWKRFKEETKEGEYNTVENLFRSHPYSSKRADCNSKHIANNYGVSCE
jgi:predicted Zn-dependent protease